MDLVEFFLHQKMLLFRDALEEEEKDLVALCNATSVFDRNKPFVFAAALAFFAFGREKIQHAKVKLH